MRKNKLDLVASPALNELKIRIGNYLPKGMGLDSTRPSSVDIGENKCSHESS